MPIHDWTRVEAGIFHDFHHGWIEEIKRTLNAGLLPDDYYALAEQHASRFEHHGWIEEIKRALNAGLLPDDYYALAEQHASRFEPDVLTLQERLGEGGQRS
jgi:hypothetical protein